MAWVVLFHPEFEAEFGALEERVQDDLLESARVLAEIGPTLGRPTVDTLKGARHANMKEMRFTSGRGVWRVAFAFDPARQAILLVAGNKAGLSTKMQAKFYRDLIECADRRFSDWMRQR
jgi:hypothetical protein